MNATATAETTTVVTQGEVRGSYVQVFEPKKNELSGKIEYSMACLIPKSDEATMAQLRAAAKAALEKKWPDPASRPPNLRSPFRDGDAERPNDEAYAGHYWINVKSQQAPGIVKLSQGQLVKVDDAREFGSGDYAQVSLNAYGYDAKGNRGVAFGLNNILVTRKGESLGGGSRAEDDFAAFASSTGADLNDDDMFG